MRWVVFNQKGGVGKSTIVCNLAAISAQEGRRTLVVDLDPQSNASHYLLGRDADGLEPNLAGLFEQTLGFGLFKDPPKGFVHHTPFDRLHVMPSSPELDALETKLETKYKIYKLRDAIKELDAEYDEIFLDTPPAFGFFTLSALIAAERCLVPFDCDDFSRRALYGLLETVDEVRADHNDGLRIGGIIVNQFQARANLPQRVVGELLDEHLPVLAPYLSASVKVRESHEAARPLPYYAPSHKLTDQYRELFTAVLNGR